MDKKRSKKEAWLLSPSQKLEQGQELFCKKYIARSPTGGWKVWRENPPVPFSKLGPNDLLDTGELLRYFGCSLVTLYRWIAKRELQPSTRIGRELFFRKADVERWVKRIGRPRPGRPRSTKK